MSIFLSHTSALEVLRSRQLSRQLERGLRCCPELPAKAPAQGELAALADRVPVGALSRPVHVLVSADRPGALSPECTVHRCRTPLPEGAAIQIADGVFCSAPELVAVQMAPQLTDLELTVLLAELLGLYAIAPGEKGGMFQRREPITSPGRMRAFLAELGPRAGTRRVRTALKAACVRSGSPRETKLALRLSLRSGLGGYGLCVLSMNEDVEVRGIHDAMSAGTRRPDLLIAAPARPGVDPRERKVVALEYLGECHNDPLRLAQDVARSNELKAIGTGEYQIRNEQYRDLDYMDGLVAAMRRELGQPRIGMTRAEAARRRELRRALYKELEHIDGITWNGKAREQSRRTPTYDPVPIYAYNLD